MTADFINKLLVSALKCERDLQTIGKKDNKMLRGTVQKVTTKKKLKKTDFFPNF
jgi:hypothetical protein